MLEKMNIDALSDIASIQGAIVGAALALIIFSAQLASVKYNRRILQDFISDRFTMGYFASLLGSIGVTTIARSANMHSLPVFAVLLFWYLINLVFLWFFVRHAITLMDPMEVAEKQIKKAEDAFEKSELSQFRERFTILGDIHYVLLKESRDTSIVEDFVNYENDNSLYSKFVGWLSKREETGNAAHWHEYVGVVSEYLKRVYFGSEESGNTEIERWSSGNQTLLLMTLCRERGQKEAIEQQLRTIRVMCADAVRKGKVSSFVLGGTWYRDVMWEAEDLKLEYVGILEFHFMRISELIIDEGKADIFRNLVGYFVDWPATRIFLDYYGLMESNYFEPAQYEQMRDLKFVEKLHGVANGPFHFDEDVCKIAEHLVQEFASQAEKRARTVEHREEITSKKERLLDQLKQLLLQTRISDVFFFVGAYCIHRQRLGYVKEIWEYKQPPDAVASYGGFDLVLFDLNKLYLQFWRCWNLAFRSDVGVLDRHEDWEPYLTDYFIVCSLRAIQKGSSGYTIFDPVPEYLPEKARLTHFHMLLHLSQDQNVSRILDRLEGLVRLAALQSLGVSEHQEQFKSGLEQARDKARATLRQYYETWELDSERIDEWKRAEKEKYEKDAKPADMLHAVSRRQLDPSKAVSKTFLSNLHFHREVLVAGLADTPIPPSNEVANQELAYFVAAILRSEIHSRPAVPNAAVQAVRQAVQEMKTKGYSPNAVLWPTTAFWEDHILTNQLVKTVSNQRLLEINGTHLKIVQIHGEKEQTFLLIFDEDKIGEWLIEQNFAVQGPEVKKNQDGKTVLVFRCSTKAEFLMKDPNAAVVIKAEAEGESVA